MTLRLRLVLALVALTAGGLAVFGVATYTLYARSEYQRLDDQIRASVPALSRQLSPAGGNEPSGPSNPSNSSNPSSPSSPSSPGGPPAPRVVVPPNTYAELRDAQGTVVDTVQISGSTAQPQLPDPLPSDGQEHTFDAGSASGSGTWRVYVGPTQPPGSGSIVVAVPLAGVTSSLQRLILIEAGAAVVLLVLLGGGSWLILRRGLRPLEQMATSARSITAGDLSRRVEPSDDRGEVGQLGLALNTMLSRIETAFREQEATEQRLRQFLADASHELRTPLTSIQGFAELFRLGADHDHVDQDVIMRRIENEATRMGVLVEDLILLARLDQTRPATRVSVDLTVLAADACSDAVAADPSRTVTLDGPAPVLVDGDEDHLRQAVANLVVNAVRHTPPGTAIDVAARVDGDEAVLVVRDHGGGLDADAATHAFDRFWQADAARAGHGVGLGLSIVAAIAEEHGGRCTAENASDGGARFSLRLPLARAIPDPAGQPDSG